MSTLRRLTTLLLAAGLLGGLAAAPAQGARERAPSKITFYFGMKRPETAAVAAWTAATDPASAGYRSFLGRREIRRRFGVDSRDQQRLAKALKRRGLRLHVDRTGVFARVTGQRRAMERLIGGPIKRDFSNAPDTFTFVPARKRVRLPGAVDRLVDEVVPTYAAEPLSGGRGGGKRVPGPDPRAGSPQPTNDGTFSGCAAAKATGGYSPDQLRTAYGLDALPSGGSVAILNAGESIVRSDISTGARCFGFGDVRTRMLLTDGQRRRFGLQSPAEPQLDLMAVRSAAPQLDAITFTQAWLGADLWFLGAAQVFDRAPVPDTLSISYAQCDRDIVGSSATPVSKASAKLMDAVLVRLGLAGVATFAAAGDSGSTCDGQSFPGAAWPGSSPFVTSVGGTRLAVDAANHRTDEVTWNDTEWLAAGDGSGAGGGGPSTAYPLPAYQSQLPSTSGKRLTPDISAHASLLPGYAVNFGDEWLEAAGTSAATPLMAAAFARLSAGERAAGRPPLGPVNGLLYAEQRSDPAAFFDVVAGNNGFDPKVPGYDAGPGYDLATGLGVPDVAALGTSLP